MMKKVIMTIGIPGSGKTTLIKKLAEDSKYSYINPDSIRKEITGSEKDQTKDKVVWDLAKSRSVNILQKNQTLVFDATFVAAKDRRNFINIFRSAGATIIYGIYFDTPYNVAIERNSLRERKVPTYVMDRMYKTLQSAPPSIEEGFDAVIVLDEYFGILKK